MSYTHILGQDSAVRILHNATENKALSHAYLFYGPESVGKRRTALEFAKALNCEVSGPLLPCGTCPPCHKIQEGLHPDLFLLEPQQVGSAREPAIKIDHVRELQKKLGFLPYEGKTKVAIINDADRMNLQSCNAFLKTLEEPPFSTVIILVTSRPQQLLPTLISRCQGIRFQPLSDNILMEIISRHAKEEEWDENTIALRASRANGQVQKALEEDLVVSLEERQELIQLIRMVSLKRMDLLFSWTKKWSRDTEGLRPLLDEMIGVLRDAAVLQVQNSNDLLVNRDLQNELLPLAQVKSRTALLSMADQVHQTQQNLQGNANVQLSLENMLLHFCEAA